MGATVRLFPMRQLMRDVTSRMIAQILWWMIFPLLSSIAVFAIPKVQSWIDALVPLPVQGRVAGVLFVLLCASVVGIIRLRKMLRRQSKPHQAMEDYEHQKDRGFWVNPKTGERVCGNCIVHGIVSPLSAVGKTQRDHSVAPVWRCGRTECDKSYARCKDDT